MVARAHTTVVNSLGIADTTGTFITREVERLELELEGILHDRHAGLTLKAGPRQKYVPRGTLLRNTRQLSLVSTDDLDVLSARLAQKVTFAQLGANILLSGVDFASVIPSSRLVFASGAVVVLDSENEPCRKAAGTLADFVRQARGLRGFVGWVERAGHVIVGETATIVPPWRSASG